MTWSRIKPRGVIYGATWSTTRANWAARHQPSHPCYRCGHPLGPMGPHLHLDHDDWDKTIIRGFSHAQCNRSAAGKLGNARQKAAGAKPAGPAICSYCKTPYVRRVAHQRFCSQPCREAVTYAARAKPVPRPRLQPLRPAVPTMDVKPCVVCGTPTTRTRCCSNECSTEAARRAQRARYQPVERKPRPLAEACVHGHVFDEENTRFRLRDGYTERACRQCHRDANKATKQRERAARNW